MRTGVFAVLAALAIGVAAGNGSAAQERRSLCGQAVAFGPATPPFGPAMQLPHVGEARRRIDFVPVLPAGRPFRIYVSREREARLRRLGLAYRSSTSRWFHVTQGRLYVSAARFEESLREQAARDLCGARSTTFRLRNGTLALLTEAKDRRLIVFRHHEVELMLLTSPDGGSASRLRALANSLTGPAMTAEVRHGFDMRTLPYPHGVLYTVTISRLSGEIPRFRRSWSRFSSDTAYTGGLVGNAKLGTLGLRPGSYLVSGSARPVTDSRSGSVTLGPPRDRCSRQIAVGDAGHLRIAVFAKGGRPCSIEVETK